MKTIELVGQVDEQHRLSVELPADIQPGLVKITLQAATDEDLEVDWRALINHSWANDWSDPREDIYTKEGGVRGNEAECTANSDRIDSSSGGSARD